ncbi:methyltransferase [Longispora sp. K20-0274]|uniref:methyltransferase n=1 Tax=Longispora sp. K20-0274 TaxID=3088255 RepID=UPI00399BDF97
MTDTLRLRATAAFVREHDAATLLPFLLPELDGLETRALAERCRFAHAALVVFPPDHVTLRAELTAAGLAPDGAPRPSVVVRDRLAERHRRRAQTLDVTILRPPVTGPDGARRTVEVFVLPVPPGSDLADLASHERAHEDEAHVAFAVDNPDPLVLHGLRTILLRRGAVPDGGGYNPHEDGTVFYFATPTAKVRYQRLELYVPGDHRDVLDVHLAAPDSGQPAERLLRLLTGAWTTQALAAAAELGVPDAMDTRADIGVEDLARATGTHPDSLGRLLRYLAMLDVVAPGPGGFRLTELGALLRAGEPHSMRPLALMYAGPFYRSFAQLGHSVRTGRDAFEHTFGAHHFAYFARHPELADLFDRSMAASSRMFGPVPAHPVFDTARRVVDIAGGTGGLLGHVLTAHPHLTGVLLERPHVLARARDALAAAGCGERCSYVAGDFADVPDDGDVYVLARILHDWDDDRCREILRHCAAAMREDASLLIVERVLPADGAASLATAWDLHMLCNVGGRERTLAHYARLLEDTGLTLADHRPLPLGASLLHARRAAPTG